MQHEITPNSPTTNSFKIENVLLLLLLAVGLCGFCYTYHAPTQDNQEMAWGQSGKIHTTAINVGESLEDVAFQVEGIQEVGLPVEFMIQGYNEQADFILDLGNGQKIKATGEKVTFTYPKRGNYQVSLLVSYEGSKQVLHQETLKIRGENLVAGR